MIFDKQDVGTVLAMADFDKPLEWGMQVLAFAIRQGFTKYDLEMVDAIYSDYQQSPSLLTELDYKFIDLTLFNAVDWLNENCVDGVVFDLGMDTFDIVLDEG